jgi:hypothetical protein
VESPTINPTFVCRWVILLVGANPFQEISCPSLLEKTHQGRPKSLTSIRRHLCDGRLRAVALLYVASGNLFELEVFGDIGRDEDIGEFTVRHEELWNKVNVPVVYTAVLLPWFASRLSISLE